MDPKLSDVTAAAFMDELDQIEMSKEALGIIGGIVQGGRGLANMARMATSAGGRSAMGQGIRHIYQRGALGVGPRAGQWAARWGGAKAVAKHLQNPALVAGGGTYAAHRALS